VNGQSEAAWQLHRFLTERDIAYVVIGGIAVQRWGEPRLTIDVDLAILLPAGGEERRLREIAAAFPPRLKDAVAFALEHRVLPIDVPGASPADLSLALPGFEEEAMTRAVAYDVGRGRSVRLCTAEDLVVYKCVAEFTQITEDREIVARFERAWESRPRT
jgi:hypothetical protein